MIANHRSRMNLLLTLFLGLASSGDDRMVMPGFLESRSQPFVQLVAGADFTCGLTDEGEAYCWGRNDRGQVGSAVPGSYCIIGEREIPCTPEPQPVRGDIAFARLYAGYDHACGLTADGRVYCWGGGVRGPIGPVPIAEEMRFTSLSTGNWFTCGVTTEGRAYCWGLFRTGTERARLLDPFPVSGADDHRFTAISADFYQACALDEEGAAYCWGNGLSDEPTYIAGPHTFSRISRGWGHTCALTAEGVAYCWGDNAYGQVGTGRVPEAHERVASPVPVAGGLRFREIYAGFGRTCGITTADELYCWGNRAGQDRVSRCFMVDAYTSCTPAPARVTGERIRSVASGQIHVCAVTTGGDGYCWGSNGSGSFGVGAATSYELTPVPVDWATASGSGR